MTVGQGVAVTGEAFFKWLYRILAIVALGVFAMVGLLLTRFFFEESSWARRSTVEVVQDGGGDTKKPPLKLRFGDLETIRGTGTTMLKVYASRSSHKRGSLSSGYGGNEMRNVVFLDPGYGQARWLFADNDGMVGEVKRLCVCPEDRNDPVIALYVESTKADSNGDGALDADDKSVPALVRPDGRGYAELSKPVDRVLDNELSSDGAYLGLLVEDGGKLLYRRYAIATFRPVSEQRVTEIKAPD